MSPRFALGLFALAFFSVSPALHGTVVWSDDFTGETAGSAPSNNFGGLGAAQDWSNVSSSNTSILVSSTGSPAPGVVLTDTNTGGEATGTVSFSEFGAFNTSNPGQGTLRIRFDFRVDSFHNTSSPASTPRLTLYPTSGTTNGIHFGFGRGDATAAVPHDLFFYAAMGGDSATPSASNAIGLSGGAFASGFNFGSFDSTGGDPENATNDTAIGAGEDEWYNFLIDYNPATGQLFGTATRISTGEFVTFSRSGAAVGALTNASPANFIVRTGQNARTIARWDNISFEVVPEPTATSLMVLGVAATLLRRRRR